MGTLPASRACLHLYMQLVWWEREGTGRKGATEMINPLRRTPLVVELFQCGSTDIPGIICKRPHPSGGIK